jgi:hypothetical protein
MLHLSAGRPISCGVRHREEPVKIAATLQPLLDASRREVPSLLKQLQVGQILPARVLAEVQPGLLRLQIAATALLARSQVSLAAGTPLRLEVVRPGPMPELRILNEAGRPDARDALVRSALARQLPAADVRQGIATLRTQPLTATQSEALRQLASVLHVAGVDPVRADAAQLRRAVALSGLFHEARLAAGAAAEPADLKAQLLKLLATLKGGTGQVQQPGGPPDGEAAAPSRDASADSLLNRLIRLVEGSVARIQLQQTAALPVDESQRQVWQFDLPIRLPDETDDVALRIEREDGREGASGDVGWAVNLAFDFDTIGTLQCRIALSGERVATTFWCEQANTGQRLQRRLPALREGLEAQGLEVVHLAGVVGEPADPLIPIPMPDTLLDERA